jgi:hypothetical protein
MLLYYTWSLYGQLEKCSHVGKVKPCHVAFPMGRLTPCCTAEDEDEVGLMEEERATRHWDSLLEKRLTQQTRDASPASDQLLSSQDRILAKFWLSTAVFSRRTAARPSPTARTPGRGKPPRGPNSTPHRTRQGCRAGVHEGAEDASRSRSDHSP